MAILSVMCSIASSQDGNILHPSSFPFIPLHPHPLCELVGMSIPNPDSTPDMDATSLQSKPFASADITNVSAEFAIGEW